MIENTIRDINAEAWRLDNEFQYVMLKVIGRGKTSEETIACYNDLKIISEDMTKFAKSIDNISK